MWALFFAALVAISVAAFPRSRDRVDPATGDRITERRLGIWSSPLHRRERRESPNGNVSIRSEGSLRSWSGACLIGGAICFEAMRQRRWKREAKERAGDTGPAS
jgi:hypothetical protein